MSDEELRVLSAPSDEELRVLALDALGEHGDERAREVLRTADLRVHWQTGMTAGFHSREAVLGLDAETLGLLRAVPALVDALHAALAVAMAKREPREKLVNLAFRWVPSRRPQASAYRDAPPQAPNVTVHAGLTAYLEGAGDQALATMLREGSAVPHLGNQTIDVYLPRAHYEALRASGYSQRRLEGAVRDLLSRADARIRLHAVP